jgi:hypothetical protein
MKRLSYLFAVLLLLGATFMISCTKTEETPQDLTPTIDFKGGSAYISGDATLDISQDFMIGITASSNSTSGTKLTSLYVSRTYNNAVWWDSTFTFSETNIDYNFQFTSLTVEGTERIYFKITDKDGQINELALNITTHHAAGLINFFTQKILGAQHSATGSSFASSDGTVYTFLDAYANQAKIDWLYYYGANDKATLASPNDEHAWLVFTWQADPTKALENWAIKNDTRFKKLDAASINWDNITDDVIIVEQTQTGVDKTRITQTDDALGVGSILGFITAGGKRGMIKIDAIDAPAGSENTGTITISVKVQQ